MARRSRRTRRRRVATDNANPRLPVEPDIFDDKWLSGLRERQYVRFVDLTDYEDRRTYHPERLSGMRVGPAPRGFAHRPRIVIVPEGHRLARLAPYGAKVPMASLLRRERRIRRRSLEYPEQFQGYDKHTNKQYWYSGSHLSRRVGFSLPWQVIICVRRKRRREVLFANKVAGRGGGLQRPPRRNFWSEVRC